MPDTFTEVSSRSWFSRIGDSIKGIFFGFLLILGAIVLLWWNEGRAIRRIKTLREGLQAVIPVSADSVDSANAGKLVQMSGLATTTETLADYEFGVSANALKLERDAEMYQWVETEKTHTQKNLGGGTTTTKTYDYQQGWRSGRIDSNHFKHPEGHGIRRSHIHRANSSLARSRSAHSLYRRNSSPKLTVTKRCRSPAPTAYRRRSAQQSNLLMAKSILVATPHRRYSAMNAFPSAS